MCVAKRLNALNLAGCGDITDAGLVFVGRLQQLEHLRLDDCDVSDVGLEMLCQQLHRLASLDLTGCFRITDNGLASVAKRKTLTALNLTSCDSITDTGIASVAKLTQLEKLNLNSCSHVTDLGVASLVSLQYRQSHSITSLPFFKMLPNNLDCVRGLFRVPQAPQVLGANPASNPESYF